MPSNIEDKVVSMRFDNSQFDGNVKKSQRSIEELESKLGELGASGIFAPFLNSIEKVGHGFSALEEVAIGALRKIGEQAVEAGEKLVKSLTVDNIAAGYQKYEQKTSSVQTIMNATGDSIDEVNEYLAQLMWYSDETSYSFTDMTSALGQMTAAGGDVKKLIPLITGLANATAYAGKGNAEFSRSIYNLNQSYTSGYLNYMDWKSFQLAGTATKQLTEELIKAGIELGKIQEGEVTLENFAGTLKSQWATTEVMEQAFGRFAEFSNDIYLAVQAGEYDTASKAMEDLADQYDELGVKAFQSAQMARTFKEAIEATIDAVSSGWMETFELLFGNIEEAKVLWTDLANTLWDMFASGAEGRNEFIGEWMGLDEGGRDDLIEAFFNILDGIQNGVSTIKEIFQDFFPPATVDAFASFVVQLRDATRVFSEMLLPLEESEDGLEEYSESATRIRKVLKVFASSLSLVRDVFISFRDSIAMHADSFKIIGDGIKSVADRVLDLALKFNEVTARIFDFEGIFTQIWIVLFAIVGAIKELFDGLFDFTELGDDFKWVADIVVYVKAALRGLIRVIEEDLVMYIPDIVAGIKKVASTIGGVLFKAFEAVKSIIPSVSKAIKNIFSAIVGALPSIKKALQGILTVAKNLFGAVLDAAPSIITAVSGIFVKLLGFAPKIISALMTIGQAVGKIVKKVISMLPSIMKSVSKLIDALLKAADKILKLLPSIVSVITNLATKIIGLLPKIIGLLPTIISTLSSLISAALPFITILVNNLPKIASIAIDIFGKILSAIPKVISVIKPLAKTALGFISNILSSLPTVGKNATTVIGAVYKAVESLVKKIPDLGSIFVLLVNKVNSLLPKVLNYISKLTKFVSNLVSESAPFIKTLISFASGLATGFISTLSKFLTLAPSIVSAVKTLAKAAENLFEKYVSALPSISKAREKVTDSLIKAIDRILKEVPNISSVVTGVITELIKLIPRILNMLPGIIDFVSELSAIAMPFILSLISKMPKIATLIVGVAEKVVGAFPAVIDFIKKAIKSFESFIKTSKEVYASVKSHLLKGIENIRSLVPNVIASVSAAFAKVQPIFQKLISGISKSFDFFGGIFSGIGDKLPDITEKLKSLFVGIDWKSVLGVMATPIEKAIEGFKSFAETAKEVYASIKSHLLKGVESIKALVPGALASVSTALSKLQPILQNVVSGISKSFDFFGGLFQGISDKLPEFTEKVKTLFSGIDWSMVLGVLAAPVGLVILAFDKLKEKLSEFDISGITKKFKKLDDSAATNVVETFAIAIEKEPVFAGAMIEATTYVKEFVASTEEPVETEHMTFFQKVVEKASEAVQFLIDRFKNFKDNLSDNIAKIDEAFKNSWFFTALLALKDFFSKIGAELKKVFSKLWAEIEENPFEAFRTIINAILEGGLLISLTKLVTILGDVSDSVGETLTSIKSGVETFAGNNLAKTMAAVSVSLVALAAALLILSFVDTKKVAASTVAIGALFGEMAIAMNKLLSLKVGSSVKIGATMIELSAAVLILSIAFKSLSEIDSDSLVSGVVSLTTIISELTAAMILMSRLGKDSAIDGGVFIAYSAGILILAHAFSKLSEIEDIWTAIGGFSVIMTEMVIAMDVLAGSEGNAMKASAAAIVFALAIDMIIPAIRKLGEMNAGTLLIGAIALEVILLEITTSMKKLAESHGSLLEAGAAAILMALAIDILIPAVRKLGEMNFADLLVGVVALGIILLEVSAAMVILSNNKGGTLVASVAAIAMGAAIEIIVDALSKLSALDENSLLTAILTLTVIIAEVVAALMLLSTTGPMSAVGAAALLIVAEALKVLSKTLIALAKVPFADLMKALAALAIAIAGITVLAVVLLPATVALAALGAALTLVSVGIIGLAAGAAMFATAITSIVAVGSLGAATLTAALMALATALIAVAPKFIVLFEEVIVGIVESLTRSIPEIVNMILSGFVAILDGIVEFGPRIISDILQLLVDLLAELAKKIPDIVKELVLIAGGAIVGLIEGIAEWLPDMIQAGWDLTIGFIEGMADGIDNNMDRLIEAFKHLGEACVNALKKIFPNATQAISDAVHELSENGIIKTIKSKWKDLKDAMKHLLEKAVDAIKEMLDKFKEFGEKVVTNIKEGWKSGWEALTKFVKEKWEELLDTFGNIKEKFKDVGKHITEGIKEGVTGAASDIGDKITGVGNQVKDKFCDIFGIASPSRVFMQYGKYIDEGLAIGIERNAGLAENSTEILGDNVASAMSETLALIAEAVSGDMDVTPTIRPVLDLSDVEAGKKSLDGMFDGSAINISNARLNASSAIVSGNNQASTNGSNTDMNGATFSFVQNNYSPKSLSAIDIYRQTRNQFSAMKRVIAHD